MTGDARFNQVFFDGAIIDDRDRLGPEGDGWTVTRTFLAHEKNSYNPAAHEGGPFGPVDLDSPAGDVQARLAGQRRAASSGRGAGRLLSTLVEHAGAGSDPLIRQEQAKLWAHRRVMGYTNQRSGRASLPAGAVGPVSKIGVSELTRRQRDLGLRVQGPAGALVDDDAWSASFQYFALSSPSLSIAGGTDEIQRNHLGERVLGLPREPEPDRRS
jgi:alkylation response protein AidB-like acyl-CoA dehydrogenase